MHKKLKSPELEVITEMISAQENQQDQPLFTEGEDQKSQNEELLEDSSDDESGGEESEDKIGPESN